ncbi:hypothetical protein K2173_013063 [Erythroxylum novogranatense]|uniref:Uncharacterized protein n=1 Tax=Erythroxylum novogranatense TaxID=1862640 RepID=A0AAV8S6Q4_9ROSI|nr:hypothetical protein K2173_013063 [Erythroxylum novogranatense]
MQIIFASFGLPSESSTGRKVATRKEELNELLGHFSIDIENPCIIMGQDSSRDFLHSGNDKDKFWATFLQQVDDLLHSVNSQLADANGHLDHLEASIKPIERN